MATLKITVGARDRLDQRTRRRIEAAKDGETSDDVQPTLNFESYAELNRHLSPKNLELLEAIAESDPDSIREAADLVDRDYKQVHTNLTELSDIGVVRFEDSGPGTPKKPTLVYDGLEIDIPFAGHSGSDDRAAP